MARYIAVDVSGILLTASDSQTTYWVVDTETATDSATGKVFGTVHSRHAARSRAIATAEWLNTLTP
jgi:hypothetical protein